MKLPSVSAQHHRLLHCDTALEAGWYMARALSDLGMNFLQLGLRTVTYVDYRCPKTSKSSRNLYIYCKLYPAFTPPDDCKMSSVSSIGALPQE